MVPYATILIPLYIVLGWLHLSNTLIGLALVLVMFHLPFGTFLMRNSFEALPIELEESARVDGCGTAGVFRRITLPLAIPSIVTVGLYTFITTWNEFLAPLIFLNDGDQYTLPIMLVNFYARQEGEIDFGALQAGAIVSIAPVLVLYLLLQRYYVSGITSGALRG
jgi:multiple sugar transport system permease protein